MNRVVVYVQNGMVTDVVAENSDINVIIVDSDIENVAESELKMVVNRYLEEEVSFPDYADVIVSPRLVKLVFKQCTDQKTVFSDIRAEYVDENEVRFLDVSYKNDDSEEDEKSETLGYIVNKVLYWKDSKHKDDPYMKTFLKGIISRDLLK
jgi:hypothetical protein